jgi:uncharacterized membrane protein HdeD (DUF308 family)
MSTDVGTPTPLRDGVRIAADEASTVSWWFLALGGLWIWFGTFMLSYKVGSLAALATLVGAALLFGGVTQLAMASQLPAMRWLSALSGVLGVVAGIVTFAWPGITLYVVATMTAWYLVFFGTLHIVAALAGPRRSLWWTGIVLGFSELLLGVWAARSWEHSLVTLLTLVGVWAICRGVNEIFTGFTLRQVGKQTRRLVA